MEDKKYINMQIKLSSSLYLLTRLPVSMERRVQSREAVRANRSCWECVTQEVGQGRGQRGAAQGRSLYSITYSSLSSWSGDGFQPSLPPYIPVGCWGSSVPRKLWKQRAFQAVGRHCCSLLRALHKFEGQSIYYRFGHFANTREFEHESSWSNFYKRSANAQRGYVAQPRGRQGSSVWCLKSSVTVLVKL